MARLVTTTDIREYTFQNVIDNVLKPNGVKVGGFPDELFIKLTEEDKERLKCNICFLIVNEPRQCTNEHLFCHTCIFAWTMTYGENSQKCPMCRCTQRNYLPNTEVRKELEEMRVHCQEKNCDFKAPLKIFLMHGHGKTAYSNNHVDLESLRPERRDMVPQFIMTELREGATGLDRARTVRTQLQQGRYMIHQMMLLLHLEMQLRQQAVVSFARAQDSDTRMQRVDEVLALNEQLNEVGGILSHLMSSPLHAMLNPAGASIAPSRPSASGTPAAAGPAIPSHRNIFDDDDDDDDSSSTSSEDSVIDRFRLNRPTGRITTPTSRVLTSNGPPYTQSRIQTNASDNSNTVSTSVGLLSRAPRASEIRHSLTNPTARASLSSSLSGRPPSAQRLLNRTSETRNLSQSGTSYLNNSTTSDARTNTQTGATVTTTSIRSTIGDGTASSSITSLPHIPRPSALTSPRGQVSPSLSREPPTSPRDFSITAAVAAARSNSIRNDNTSNSTDTARSSVRTDNTNVTNRTAAARSNNIRNDHAPNTTNAARSTGVRNDASTTAAARSNRIQNDNASSSTTTRPRDTSVRNENISTVATSSQNIRNGNTRPRSRSSSVTSATENTPNITNTQRDNQNTDNTGIRSSNPAPPIRSSITPRTPSMNPRPPPMSQNRSTNRVIPSISGHANSAFSQTANVTPVRATIQVSGDVASPGGQFTVQQIPPTALNSETDELQPSTPPQRPVSRGRIGSIGMRQSSESITSDLSTSNSASVNRSLRQEASPTPSANQPARSTTQMPNSVARARSRSSLRSDSDAPPSSTNRTTENPNPQISTANTNVSPHLQSRSLSQNKNRGSSLTTQNSNSRRFQAPRVSGGGGGLSTQISTSSEQSVTGSLDSGISSGPSSTAPSPRKSKTVPRARKSSISNGNTGTSRSLPNTSGQLIRARRRSEVHKDLLYKNNDQKENEQ